MLKRYLTRMIDNSTSPNQRPSTTVSITENTAAVHNILHDQSADQHSAPTRQPAEDVPVQSALARLAAEFDVPVSNINELAFIAVQNGHIDVLTELANSGVNLNIVDYNGITLPYMAAQEGQPHIITALANLGVYVDMPDHDGVTPVLAAAELGHLEVIIELARLGADLNVADHNGTTMAYIAAQNGHVHVISELARRNVNVNAPGHEGTTPVSIAAQKGHKHAIIALKMAGADVNQPNNRGATPVFIAAQHGQVGVIYALAVLKANLNTPDNDGYTPALAAVWLGYAHVIIALAQYGANLDTPNKHGDTPAYVAAFIGHLPVIIALAELGANLNAPDLNGMSPIFIAAQKGHFDIVRFLLKHPSYHVKPLVCTVSKLNNLVKKYDIAVIKRMNDFIVSKQMTAADESEIAVLPKDIAAIMGHQDIVNLFTDVLPLKQSQNSSFFNATKNRTPLNNHHDSEMTYQTARVKCLDIMDALERLLEVWCIKEKLTLEQHNTIENFLSQATIFLCYLEELERGDVIDKDVVNSLNNHIYPFKLNRDICIEITRKMTTPDVIKEQATTLWNNLYDVILEEFIKIRPTPKNVKHHH